MDKREILESKILDDASLGRILAYWNFKSQKVALAYCIFDFLKPGTIEMLIQAANKGTVLLVALKPDHIVTKHKGEGFPKNPQSIRALALAAQMLVSGVYIVDKEDPSELIDLVKPETLVYCQNAVDVEVKAFEKVLDWGGEIIQVDTDSLPAPDPDITCC